LTVVTELEASDLVARLLESRNLESVLELGEIHPSAQGRGISRIVALADRGEKLHVRAIRHGGILAPLWGSKILNLERPRRELGTTLELQRRGISTPRPALVCGWRANGLWRAVFATYYEEGTQNGIEFLASEPASGHLDLAARAAARAIRKLHDAGCRHADLHLGNLLLRRDSGAYRVWIIDLDKASLAAPVSPSRRMSELMRLYRSLWKHSVRPEVRESLANAFWETYWAGDVDLRNAMLTHFRREQFRVGLHLLSYRIRSLFGSRTRSPQTPITKR
jgi:tRNA A-37 threonylcarbamoyl transferase component Bud32